MNYPALSGCVAELKDWAVEVHTSTEPPHFENNIKVFRHGMVRDDPVLKLCNTP
jgi:hypothetical protein